MTTLIINMKNSQADLAKQLTQIGIAHYDAQVYIGLLRRGLTVAGALSKYLKMKRSTVYSSLDNLIAIGLVSLTSHDGVKHYQAESIDRLDDYLSNKMKEVQDQQGLLESLRGDLKNLESQHHVPPSVTIYEGQRGVLNLLMKTLDNNPEEILVIGQHNPQTDHIPEFTERRIQRKIPTRVIASDSPWLRKELKKDKRSFRKTTCVDQKIPASVHIYEDSVILFTYTGDDPVGVHIENEDIATTFKIVYEMLEESLT